MSLAELSRPRTSLGCLYSEAQVAALRAWMTSGATGPALATASPGSGLTTLVTLLVRETGLEPVWLGSSTQRHKHVLETAGASAVSVTLRRKIIIIDELDAMTGGDSAALAEVTAFAKSNPPLPVLFVGHATRSQKTLEFAKKWPTFQLGRPSKAAMTAYLKEVVRRHAIPVDDAELDALLTRGKAGDLRSALMALELARSGGSAHTVDAPDEASDGLDLVEQALRGDRGLTVRDCLHMFGMEMAMVPMGLYENYLAALSKDDLEAARVAADGFSAGDVVDRHMYARQAWDLMDTYGVCSVAVPCLALQRHRRRRPAASFGVTKFGSVWSKVYNMCAKTKHHRQLRIAMAENRLIPLGVCDMSFVRERLKGVLLDKASTDEDVRRACWPFNAAHVLHLVRLSVGSDAWYKQTLHARVKRALAAAP